MLLGLCQPACSLLFAPTAASEDGGAGIDGRAVFDGGAIDAARDAESGEPDASIFEGTYDFENGVGEWQLGDDCIHEEDEFAPDNMVVCCAGEAQSTTAVMFLDIGSARGVEVAFRLRLESAQVGEFSVVVGANDYIGLEDAMVANLHQRPENATSARLGVAGSASIPSTTPPVPIKEWLDVGFSASTATDCHEATVTVLSGQTSSSVIHPLGSGPLPAFTHVLFGVIRQPTTQTTRRCFDDITIRTRHTCDL
mgnify:FL=1|tara:strand:- start:118427 stop:119185 length:759 start_codon:yes stop_codon:yes gene_type:complete